MEKISYHYDCSGVQAYTNFGQKVYIECGNVLRAAYLLRVEWFFINKKEQIEMLGRSKVKTVFKTAGLGEYSVELKKGIYYSPEEVGINNSAKAFKSKKKELKWNYLRMKELLPVIFEGIAEVEIEDRYSNSFNIFRWKWNGIKAEKVYLNFTKATLTESGWMSDVDIPDNTFTTMEECENANQISVIEFDE